MRGGVTGWDGASLIRLEIPIMGQLAGIPDGAELPDPGGAEGRIQAGPPR